jgi:hypothetical protein
VAVAVAVAGAHARRAAAAALAELRASAAGELVAAFDAACAERARADAADEGGPDATDAPPRAVTAETAPAVWGECRAANASYAAKTVLAYLKNIMRDTSQSTYRRIAMTNKAFCKISKVPGVEALFAALGFELQPPFYELLAEPKLPFVLTTVLRNAELCGGDPAAESVPRAAAKIFEVRLSVVEEVSKDVSELQAELALGPRALGLDEVPPIKPLQL